MIESVPEDPKNVCISRRSQELVFFFVGILFPLELTKPETNLLFTICGTQHEPIWLYYEGNFPAKIMTMFTHVHPYKPLTLVHLKANIRQVMTKITPNLCQKEIDNYLKGIEISKVLKTTDIVFHT